MRRISRGLLLLIPIVAGTPLSAQIGNAVDREVFTRAQLEAAGMARLSELMPWLGTSVGTVEGLNWMLSVDDLAPAYLMGGGSGPAIFIDGQRVMTGAHGAIMPELLPVSLPQIDSIVVIRSAELTHGLIGGRGSIHFHTAQPVRGPSFRSWARHGAETGDPGPYRYTEQATPNIDRAGPDRVGVAAYGADGWDAEVSARSFRTGLSDSLVWAGFGEFPNVFGYARGAGLKLGGGAGGGRHQLIAGRHYQFGQTYLPDSGRVSDSEVALNHAGLGGSLILAGAELRYGLTHSSITTEPIPAGTAEERARTHASTDVRAVRGAWALSGGLAFERGAVESDDPAETTAAKQYGAALGIGAEHAAGRRAEHLYAGLRSVGGAWAEQLAARITWQRTDRRVVTAGVSYAGRSAEPSSATSYDLLSIADQGSYALFHGSIGLEDRLRGFPAAASVIIGATSSGEEDFPDSQPRPQSGSYLGFNARLETPPTSRVSGRLLYRAMQPLSNAQAFPASSRHQLRGFLHYSPNRSLRLGAATIWKSAPDWPEDEYGPLGGSQPDPLRRLDLSVEKWFWGRRLRTQLILGNLLMVPERYHPSGADYSFRYFIGGSLNLPARD